jgi:3'(2'), 5'-bisphosphate nucleotidase
MTGVQALWDELESSLTPLLRQFRSRLDSLDVSRKPDQTLLTEADIAVQEHIVARIRAHDPGASIVAEENRDESRDAVTSRRAWIIDPIDGTAEFVRPGRREYCSVVCLVEDCKPVAALVVAPEVGIGGTPVSVRVAGPGSPIEVNRRQKDGGVPAGRPLRASVTRSSAAAVPPWERLMSGAGFKLKTRTTSQTLDMVRTSVDLSKETGGTLPPFALFYRERQKVWDGVAGACLARTAGLRVCDRHGTDREEIDIDLGTAEPTFASTLVAASPLVDQFVDWSSE